MKNSQTLLYFIILSFIFCGFIQEFWCYLITKTSLRNYVIDIPNSRSSHSAPTPRGGGALFSFFASASFIFLSLQGFLPWAVSIPLSVTSVLIAAVGFFDDLKGLNARLRFFFQFFSVLINVFALFFYAKNSLPIGILCITLLFWFVYSISLINFYNFADGINGYIAIQFLVSIFTYTLYIMVSISQKESFLSACLVLIVPIFGGILFFLRSNFVKKSLFMGDTGSTFLGSFLAIIFFLLSVFMFKEQKFGILTPYAMLLTWIFFSQIIFLDCACMVVAKIILKIPFSKSHKLHLYQILSQNKAMGHTKTTFLLGVIQIFLNIAFIVCSKFIDTRIFFVLVLMYLIIITIRIIKKHMSSLQQQILP